MPLTRNIARLFRSWMLMGLSAFMMPCSKKRTSFMNKREFMILKPSHMEIKIFQAFQHIIWWFLFNICLKVVFRLTSFFVHLCCIFGVLNKSGSSKKAEYMNDQEGKCLQGFTGTHLFNIHVSGHVIQLLKWVILLLVEKSEVNFPNPLLRVFTEVT